MSTLITIGQIIDIAVDHYHKHYKELLGIALWILVAFIPLGIVGLIMPSDQTALENLSAGRYAFVSGINILGTLAVAVVSIWVAISMIFMIDAQFANKKTDAKIVGRKAWSIFIPFSILSTLVAIIVIIPALVLVLPGLAMMIAGSVREGAEAIGSSGLFLFGIGALVGLYFIIRLSIELSFSQYELILDPQEKPLSWKALKGAMTSSRELVRGRWWATLWRIALPNVLFSLAVFVVNIVLTIGAGMLLAASASALPNIAIKLGAVAISFGAVGVNVLAAPLYTIATYALYDSLVATRGRTGR